MEELKSEEVKTEVDSEAAEKQEEPPQQPQRDYEAELAAEKDRYLRCLQSMKITGSAVRESGKLFTAK